MGVHVLNVQIIIVEHVLMMEKLVIHVNTNDMLIMQKRVLLMMGLKLVLNVH